MQQNQEGSMIFDKDITFHSNNQMQVSQKELSNQINESMDQNDSNDDEPMRRNLLTPANPIIDKEKQPDEQISMRFLEIQRRNSIKKRRQPQNSLRKSKKINEQIQMPLQMMTLFNGYESENMLYRKFDNTECNQLNKKKYFSSIFYPIYLRQNCKFEVSTVMHPFEGMRKTIDPQAENQSLILNLQDQLEFNSNFESGNLFAVFKTGHHTYDLVLQNDMNTIGCTQWFYFSVKNKKNKDIMVTFNIINLYKASSLYNKGMKPMVHSAASGKGWKRKGQNIFYQKNSITREGLKKYYSSLSFSYDFTKEDDTVEFAHSVPYTYARLMQLIKKAESSKKCIVKSLGTTPLKKTIPIIKFESQDQRLQKRALIIMARQHPGQVQGSFAVEQIVLSFLKPSTQIDFLLWRFNVYIIPMVNVDGVHLGNYRCNAMGYDLNRNWQSEQKSKHPEVVYIKNEIKKIMSKQPIQLILDLHGHSNKMNSFFYGNPFGPNPYVFPYAASKTCPFIAFQNCTFSLEKKQKARTARCVLGSMIKETGNVYTYEMSFYGGTKNGKIVNFYQQNFKQLGRDLLTSIYKVYVQSYKEEKTLKESLYLKEIRKEVSKIQEDFTTKNDSDSDSQAEEDRDQMEQERKEELQQKLKELFQLQSNADSTNNFGNLRKSQNFENSSDVGLIEMQKFSEHNRKISLENSSVTQKLIRNKSMKHQQMDPFIGIFKNDESLQYKLNKQRDYAQRLKIFGENYLPKPAVWNQSQQMRDKQLSQKAFMKVSSIFQDRKRQAMKMDFVINARNNRNRNSNFYTLSPIKNDSKDHDSLINDIVKVHRIEYKRIQREKDRLRAHKYAQKKISNQGVFKLPSIVNNFKI